MTRLAVLCILSVFAFVPLASAAWAADPWTVVQSVGDVNVSVQGITPAAVAPKQDLPNGATITTGETGRAIIVRGQETIMIAPKSSVVLPSSGAGKTTIFQRSGTMIFKVGKRPVAHFEVDTPYLAAIVKGTIFTLSVTESGAAVAVHEGAVEVRTKDSAMSVLTKAGQVSRVLRFALSEILTTGILLPSDPTDVNWSERNEDVELPGVPRPTWTKTNGIKLKTGSSSNAAARPWDAVRISKTRRAEQADIHKTENTSPGAYASATKDAVASPADDARTHVALTDAWQLKSIQGRVAVDGSAVASLKPGFATPIAAGSAVSTGADGSATLANKHHTITLSANAQIVLPGGAFGQAPTFTHQRGDVTYHSKASEAISVAAPLLAAISKGGAFRLHAGGAQTLVEPVGGKVEVVPYQGPDSVQISSGDRAWVSANAPSVLESQGGKRVSKHAQDDARLNTLAGIFSGPTRSAQAVSESSQTSAMLRRLSYQTAQFELPGTGTDFSRAPSPRAASRTDPTASAVPDVAAKPVQRPVSVGPDQPIAAPSPSKQTFKVTRPVAFSTKKQEEVRSKGLSVLEMGLYALFGLGLAAGGAVWFRRLGKRGPEEPSAQQVRLRSIATPKG